MDFVPLLAFASAAFDAACAHCLGSLAGNALCGRFKDYDGYERGTYTAEGINALCEALKSATTLTSLKYASQLYASQLESLRTVNSL